MLLLLHGSRQKKKKKKREGGDCRVGVPPELRALGLVAMSGHVGVALAAEVAVAKGARWDALAPGAAGPTCSAAHIWP